MRKGAFEDVSHQPVPHVQQREDDERLDESGYDRNQQIASKIGCLAPERLEIPTHQQIDGIADFPADLTDRVQGISSSQGVLRDLSGILNGLGGILNLTGADLSEHERSHFRGLDAWAICDTRRYGAMMFGVLYFKPDHNQPGEPC